MSVVTCHARDPYHEDPATDHEVTFTGAVLSTREANHYDDSDFYATVWDEESQSVREIQYATTRGWTYHNSATVDATDEIRAKAIAWAEPNMFRELVELFGLEIHKGEEVRSLKTRGKNVGLVGIVGWTGRQHAYNDRYHRYPQIDRVGIKVDGERGYRFMNAIDVEKTEPVPRDVMAELSARAAYQASYKYGKEGLKS